MLLLALIIGGLLVLALALYMRLKSSRKNEKDYSDVIEKSKKLQVEFDKCQLKVEELINNREELNRNLKELDDVKRATVNILEDFAEDKEQLLELNAKNAAVFASIGDGLAITDEKAMVTYMNEAAEKMLGKETKECLGGSWAQCANMKRSDGQAVELDESLVYKALVTGKTQYVFKYDIYYTHKDKSTFPVAITASPIVAEGKTIGAVAVFRDVTEAQQMDTAKTEFVSLASHQLRTPLSIVNWYTEMLMNGDAGQITDEQKEYLTAIYSGNKRMIKLVNALLDTSRIDLGVYTSDMDDVDIVNLARNVIEEYAPCFENKKISLKKKLPEEMPPLRCDEKFIKVVVQNLLSNASRYTDEGGEVFFELGLASSGEAIDEKEMTGDSVLIKVSDNGCGIPKNQQAGVFDKLYRAENAKKKNTEGTGLGLYMVKSIIEKAGGEIWFESEVNKGTTFFVTIPYKKTSNNLTS